MWYIFVVRLLKAKTIQLVFSTHTNNIKFHKINKLSSEYVEARVEDWCNFQRATTYCKLALLFGKPRNHVHYYVLIFNLELS